MKKEQTPRSVTTGFQPDGTIIREIIHRSEKEEWSAPEEGMKITTHRGLFEVKVIKRIWDVDGRRYFQAEGELGR